MRIKVELGEGLEEEDAENEEQQPLAYQHEPLPRDRDGAGGDGDGDPLAAAGPGVELDIARMDPANTQNWYILYFEREHFTSILYLNWHSLLKWSITS